MYMNMKRRHVHELWSAMMDYIRSKLLMASDK